MSDRGVILRISSTKHVGCFFWHSRRNFERNLIRFFRLHTAPSNGRVAALSALSSSSRVLPFLPLTQSPIVRGVNMAFVTCCWVNDTISSPSVSPLGTLITHFPSLSGDLCTSFKSDCQPSNPLSIDTETRKFPLHRSIKQGNTRDFFVAAAGEGPLDGRIWLKLGLRRFVGLDDCDHRRIQTIQMKDFGAYSPSGN